MGQNGVDQLAIEDGSTVSAPTLTLGTSGSGEVSLFGELTTFTVAAGDIEMGVNGDGSGGLAGQGGDGGMSGGGGTGGGTGAVGGGTAILP